MAYKDKEKQKLAVREAVRRFRARVLQRGITGDMGNGVIPIKTVEDAKGIVQDIVSGQKKVVNEHEPGCHCFICTERKG
jgi:hypothetical protein